MPQRFPWDQSPQLCMETPMFPSPLSMPTAPVFSTPLTVPGPLIYDQKIYDEATGAAAGLNCPDMQATQSTVIPGLAPLQMQPGAPPDIVPESTIYVNPKQFHRILKRRVAREKQLEETDGHAKERGPYIYESRHKHATNRLRGPGGRFLNAEETARVNAHQLSWSGHQAAQPIMYQGQSCTLHQMTESRTSNDPSKCPLEYRAWLGTFLNACVDITLPDEVRLERSVIAKWHTNSRFAYDGQWDRNNEKLGGVWFFHASGTSWLADKCSLAEV